VFPAGAGNCDRGVALPKARPTTRKKTSAFDIGIIRERGATASSRMVFFNRFLPRPPHGHVFFLHTRLRAYRRTNDAPSLAASPAKSGFGRVAVQLAPL